MTSLEMALLLAELALRVMGHWRNGRKTRWAAAIGLLLAGGPCPLAGEFESHGSLPTGRCPTDVSATATTSPA